MVQCTLLKYSILFFIYVVSLSLFQDNLFTFKRFNPEMISLCSSRETCEHLKSYFGALRLFVASDFLRIHHQYLHICCYYWLFIKKTFPKENWEHSSHFNNFWNSVNICHLLIFRLIWNTSLWSGQLTDKRCVSIQHGGVALRLVAKFTGPYLVFKLACG